LVDMNLHQEFEPFLPLLQLPNGSEVLNIAYRISGMYRSANTINSATDRASKVVFALKNYSRQDHTGEKQLTNINSSVETVLILYQTNFKKNVEVTTNFGTIPEIMCYADEIVQVWTNLLHNALQAMNYEGKIYIETKLVEKNIIFSLQDTGGGIPEHIQDKIFNAFFTTKKAGEGTGLGLDIVRKIIDKHEGKIWFESETGVGTTFFVQLPAILA
jgi:signal transduction histidine kinase